MLVVAAGLVVKDGKILVCQRPKHKAQGGKWEFPGGKLEPGESPEQALQRELMEELGLKTTTLDIARVLFHRYEGYDVLLLVYWSVTRDEPCAREGQGFAWRKPEEIALLDFSAADKPLADALAAGLTTIPKLIQ